MGTSRDEARAAELALEFTVRELREQYRSERVDVVAGFRLRAALALLQDWDGSTLRSETVQLVAVALRLERRLPSISERREDGER